MDRSRFNTLKSFRTYNLIEIMKKPLNDRNSNEEFFLMMHVMTQVPFFSSYDKRSLTVITSCFKLDYFLKDEVIVKKGSDP